MHRHSYQGRKLQLDSGPRKALIRGQLTSLVLYEGIKTTEAKAKEVAPRFERLVTKAKLRTLTGQRDLRKVLLTENAVQKMIQELEPQFRERKGGYTRIIKLENRRGDNAPMALLSLVLDPVKLDETSTKKPTSKAVKAPETDSNESKADVARDKSKEEAKEEVTV